jgi:uncharacterized protein
MPAAIVIFTRLPEAGKAKTRMIPALGPEGAADLQRRMTRLVVARVSAYCSGTGGRLVVACEGGSPAAMQEWLGPGPLYVSQRGVTLGDRLLHAARAELDRGAEKVILIGADCPRLCAEHLRRAEYALEDTDLVFGPADDGGYYLMGMKRVIPSLFIDIPWGSGTVLARSLERAGEAGLSPFLIETLPDVDDPDDLADAVVALEAAAKVSVIVATLNEAKNLGRLLPLLRRGGISEIIVSDGGSGDGTLAIASSHGARIVSADRGRASQMNAGASLASGEYLLFLHADTDPPEGFASLIREELDRPGIVAGAFGFHLREPVCCAGLIESLVSLRCRILRLPYGDQGLFMRRDLFLTLGGYPEHPILEDLILVRRLRNLGRVVITREKARTSSRRWREGGVVATFLRHSAILLAYHAGVSPERIAVSIISRDNKCRGRDIYCPEG